MAPDPPSAEREAERRLSVRTLAIASVASAAAAIVTSQFWIAGTPFAAALTPVIVALVSELLHRPTEAIAQRLTAEDPALPLRHRPAGRAGDAEPSSRRAGRAGVPGADGAAAERRRRLPPPEPAAAASTRAGEPPITVYGPARRPRRRIAVGVVLATGLLAFLIAAVALTVPELIAGGSIGKGERSTTFFGARDRASPGTTTPAETVTETVPRERGTPAEEPYDEPASTAPARRQATQPTTPAPRTTTAPATTQTSPPPRR